MSVCVFESRRVEPLIKDTLNKGHLCIKDTFRCTNLYSGNTFLPLKEDNLSIMDKMICPNVSILQRFHCTQFSTKNVTHFRSGITKQKHVLTHCTGGNDDFSPDPLGMSIPLTSSPEHMCIYGNQTRERSGFSNLCLIVHLSGTQAGREKFA